MPCVSLSPAGILCSLVSLVLWRRRYLGKGGPGCSAGATRAPPSETRHRDEGKAACPSGGTVSRQRI